MADYTGPDRRYNRDRLKLQPLKGFYLTEPLKLTELAAPLDIADPAGNAIANRVAIQNGMVIVVAGAGEYIGGVAASATSPGFRNGVAADATGASRPYIAYGDYDSHDVIQSGKLVGLDCGDTYELMVPYFDDTVTYTQGCYLTYAAGGKLTKTTTPGDAIVGYVKSVGSNANGSHPYAGKTPGATFTQLLHIVTGWTGAEVPA